MHASERAHNIGHDQPHPAHPATATATARKGPLAELQCGVGNRAMAERLADVSTGRWLPEHRFESADPSRPCSGVVPRRGNDHPVARALTLMQATKGNRFVQRLVEGTATGGGDRELAERIAADAGTGERLDSGLRRKLEPVLGADLGTVRLHTGPEADHLARSVRARAFTSGQDIWFRSGAFDPRSAHGLRTIAHEVAHTVQQASGAVDGQATPGGALTISDPDDRFERAAHAAADAVVSGTGPPPAVVGPTTAPAGPSVQREENPDKEKDYFNYQFQMDPKLQAKFYPQGPEALRWAGYDPMALAPTGGQYDVRHGGVSSSGHLNLAGAQAEFLSKKLVLGKDGKPEYQEMFGGKGGFDFSTKEGQARFFANMDLDPVKIKALAELSTKEGVKGSAEARAELEALKLRATLAGGSAGFDAKLMGEYGFDKGSISALLGAGSAGYSAEALAKLGFGKTDIAAMLKYGPAGPEGSLKGNYRFGLGEIYGFLNANAQTAEAGAGARLNFPGGYGLGGSIGTRGYTATGTMPISPLSFGGGLTPTVSATVAGDGSGGPTIVPQMGLAFVPDERKP